MTILTVYAKGSAFRVVSGTHSPTSDVTMGGCAMRRYADANEAYGIETDPFIREAIARIAPEVLAISPTKMHHVVRAPASRAEARRVEAATRKFWLTFPNNGLVLNSLCVTREEAETLLSDRVANGHAFSDEKVTSGPESEYAEHRERTLGSR